MLLFAVSILYITLGKLGGGGLYSQYIFCILHRGNLGGLSMSSPWGVQIQFVLAFDRRA